MYNIVNNNSDISNSPRIGIVIDTLLEERLHTVIHKHSVSVSLSYSSVVFLITCKKNCYIAEMLK